MDATVKCMRMLKLTFLGVHHDDAVLIRDNVDTRELVPYELAEHDILVIIAPFTHVCSVRLSKDLLIATLSNVISLVYVVSVHDRLGHDAELVVVARIELHLHELLSLAWQFRLWHHELLVLLDVEDGDAEIRHSANHKQVLSVSGESEANTLDSCINWERLDECSVLRAIDVHFWLESILSSC